MMVSELGAFTETIEYGSIMKQKLISIVILQNLKQIIQKGVIIGGTSQAYIVALEVEINVD